MTVALDASCVRACVTVAVPVAVVPMTFTDCTVGWFTLAAGCAAASLVPPKWACAS